MLQYNYSISFADSRKKALYEAVEQIIATFLPQQTNVSYVQYFLDLVLERDMKYQSSTSDFLEYWERVGFKQSIPSPEGGASGSNNDYSQVERTGVSCGYLSFADDSTRPIDPKSLDSC